MKPPKECSLLKPEKPLFAHATVQRCCKVCTAMTKGYNPSSAVCGRDAATAVQFDGIRAPNTKVSDDRERQKAEKKRTSNFT